MRKTLGLILVAIILSALIVGVTGCGAKESGAVLTPSGSVSIKKNGNKVEVTKDGKTTTWTAETTNEKNLAFPIPDTAKLVKGTAIEATGPGSEKWIGGSFYSDDDINTVIAYYKDKLTGMEGFTDTSKTMSGQMVGLFSVKSGDTIKSVIIKPAEQGEQGKTWIQVSSASNTKV